MCHSLFPWMREWCQCKTRKPDQSYVHLSPFWLIIVKLLLPDFADHFLDAHYEMSSSSAWKNCHEQEKEGCMVDRESPPLYAAWYIMSPKSQQTCFLGGLVIMTMIYMFLYHLQTLFRLNEIRLANSRQIQCLPGSSLRELSIVCGISLMLCKFSQNNSQTKNYFVNVYSLLPVQKEYAPTVCSTKGDDAE